MWPIRFVLPYSGLQPPSQLWNPQNHHRVKINRFSLHVYPRNGDSTGANACGYTHAMLNEAHIDLHYAMIGFEETIRYIIGMEAGRLRYTAMQSGSITYMNAPTISRVF